MSSPAPARCCWRLPIISKPKGRSSPRSPNKLRQAKINRFARGLWRSPAKMLQAAALRARLVGSSLSDRLLGHSAQCRSPHDSKGMILTQPTLKFVVHRFPRRGKTRTIDCDYLACGFHLVPNTELASLLGCQLDDGFVAVDEFQQNIEPRTFIARANRPASAVSRPLLIEGTIAGLCGGRR